MIELRFEARDVYRVEKFGTCGCCDHVHEDGSIRNSNDEVYYSFEGESAYGRHSLYDHTVVAMVGTPFLVRRPIRHIGVGDTPGTTNLTTRGCEATRYSRPDAEDVARELGGWFASPHSWGGYNP